MLLLMNCWNNSKKTSKKREAGWLVIGVTLGNLLSISVNLWTDYYMEVVKVRIEFVDFVIATIFMIDVLFLF